MITRQQITMVLDHPVYDPQGNKVGEAKHVFLDDASGRPEWVSVRTGLFGSSESFVPVKGATLVEDHLEVAYPRDRIKDAPHVDVDDAGHLPENEEQRLYDYYGIDWDRAWAEARRTGRATPGDMAARSKGQQGAAARGGDGVMTRSEERLRVTTERYESGRARLHKYVVTEEQETTVPLHHDEVRIVREPITDADRTGPGPELAEDEYEIVLHEERAVVETETVPVERVLLTAEDHVEQETVRGQVRKERIEAETPGEGRHPLD